MRLINVTLLDREKEKITNRRERERGSKPKDIHKGDVLKVAGRFLGSASR